MSDGVVLQCARVDRWANRSGRDHQLPTVSDGSTTAACVMCRAQVWICKQARRLAIKGDGIKPLCDVCQPADPIGVLPGLGNT